MVDYIQRSYRSTSSTITVEHRKAPVYTRTYTIIKPSSELAATAERIKNAALKAFDTIGSLFGHFASMTSINNPKCYRMSLTPRELQGRCTRLGRKLRFMTDGDVAHQALKGENLEIYNNRHRLIFKSISLDCKINSLKSQIKQNSKLMAALNLTKKEIFNSFKQALAFKKEYFPDYALIELQAEHNSLDNIFQTYRTLSWMKEMVRPRLQEALSLGESVTKKTRALENLQNELQDITDELSLMKIALPENLTADATLCKLNLDPLVHVVFGKEQKKHAVFCASEVNFKLVFEPHAALKFNRDMPLMPVTVDWLMSRANQQIPSEITNEDRLQFIEQVLLPNCHVDFTAQGLLDKFAEALPRDPKIRDLFNEDDLKDVITLDIFEDPISLTCGHSFSQSSLNMQDKCPCCREPIDYDSMLPNELIHQLSLIKKIEELENKQTELMNKINEANELLENDKKLLQEMDALLEKFAEFDNTLDNIQSKITFISDNFCPFNPYDSNIDKTLDEYEQGIEEKNSLLEEEKCCMQVNAEQIEQTIHDIEYISPDRLKEREHTLVDAFQRGDLNALITMDNARVQYKAKLQNKLENARKDLAAFDYIAHFHPEMLESMQKTVVQGRIIQPS